MISQGKPSSIEYLKVTGNMAPNKCHTFFIESEVNVEFESKNFESEYV